MAPPSADPERPYHHGNLRQALLDAAVDAIAEQGLSDVSLRDVARRAGVSHAAPAHHFGTKAGLFTALATDGFARFTAAMEAAADFEEVGLAYVRFAVANPSVFELMFRPDLLLVDDAALLTESARAYQFLLDRAADVAASMGVDAQEIAVTAWSLVHGFATLWIHGNLGNQPTDDPAPMARAALRHALPGPAVKEP